MDYAIRTVGLIKRYPARGRKGPSGGGRHGVSISGLLEVMRGAKGSFVEALKGIDLNIEEGESFGILGPNGAGKTTLIKILCTLVIHDEGEAYVHGFDVRKHPKQVLKNLQAILPESRGFTWRLTGRQNLEFYALLYGLQERESRQRIDYLLELTGLKERADDGYQRYSTGMQRKLLLCRALLRDTPTLLFDEPTTGLDPPSAAEFRNLLHHRLAHEEGKTIVISTHNLAEAQDMCDRIAILDRGKLLVCDTPDRIRHTVFDTRIFEITLLDAVLSEKHRAILNELRALPGIHNVALEADTDGNFDRISLRMKQDTDISQILGVIVRSGLKVGRIGTREPTLEDAFMAITRRPTGGQSGRGEL